MSKSLVGKLLWCTKEAHHDPEYIAPFIPVGSNRVFGYLREEIIPGEQMLLFSTPDGGLRAWTSTVLSFDETTMTLHTRNSIYKIEAEEATENADVLARKKFKPQA